MASLAALAVASIVEILVEGNRKTTDATVREIADLAIGEAWTDAAQRRAESELISSGLFRDVAVTARAAGDDVHVTLRVRDKHSWIIAPTWYDQPTNRGGGLGFGENNLFGRNEKLLLYGQVATGDSFFLGAFIDPRVAGTWWRAAVDVYLRSARVIEYAPPRAWRDDPAPVRVSRMDYLNVGLKVGREVADDTTVDVRLRGATVGFRDVRLADDATHADVGVAPGAAIPSPGADGVDVSIEALATYDARTNRWGLQDGVRIGLTAERALPALSDFQYLYLGAAVTLARTLPLAMNVVARAALGVGHDLPFQQEYSIGGPSHRGLENGQLRGDLRGLVNLEYSVPVASYRGLALRGLAFVDAGYAGFHDVSAGDAEVRHHLPGAATSLGAGAKTSVGVGTRVFLRQVVLPLLGLDFGYGVERRAFEVYLAIGLVE